MPLHVLPLRIFIGYDLRETVAYHVLAHSIIRRASRPVAIIPVARQHLGLIHDRLRGPLDSTDFSITRFLVPYLSGYEGVSIFMDCDMLCRVDITDLPEQAAGIVPGMWHLLSSPSESVWVVQHDYTPKDTTKFMGQPQTAYPRKNWSSMIVFDNVYCTTLTPDYVNTASGLDLHRFAWLQDDQIGSLSRDWNHLVGEYEPNANAKIIHWTNGGPWFKQTVDAEYADEWFAEYADLRGHSPWMTHF